jgi:hypothetical protein
VPETPDGMDNEYRGAFANELQQRVPDAGDE